MVMNGDFPMNSDDLWMATFELFCLLTDRVKDEESYQSYFERHPVVFQVLGFDSAASFEKKSGNRLPYCDDLGFTPEPDFICADTKSGEVTIFELKTPFETTAITKGAAKNRTKFKAKLETYISQTEEYIDCIQGNPEAREVVKDVLTLKEISSYAIKIVFGIFDPNEAISIANLSSKRKKELEIISFDGVLDRLVNTYSVGRPDIIARDGMCLMIGVRFPEVQVNTKAYILDMGSPDANRISITIENGELIVECVDSSGISHKSVCDANFGVVQIIRFEFSNDDNGILIGCCINNKEIDFRVGTKALQAFPDFEKCSYGSDLAGLNNACFDMFRYVLLKKTLSLHHKLQTQKWISDGASPPTRYLEFNGTNRMVSVPIGMQATSDKESPTLRELK